MYRDNVTKILLILTVVIGAVSTVLAQNAPVAGRVQLKKADGTLVPVQGALVEVFRIDIKTSLPSDKTDKKGYFSFAGLPMASTLVLSVSASGAKPAFFADIHPGRNSENIEFTLEEGDGRRWTEAEIRTAMSQPAATKDSKVEQTAEQKAAQAEYERKVAEVTAKNKDIENKNAIVKRSLEEGNAAFKAKDLNTAIAKYTEGINADPDFVGSAPVLLSNRSLALRDRARELFNQTIKLTDLDAKTGNYAKVKKDLGDAAEGYSKAWIVLKNASPEDIPDQNTYAATKTRVLSGALEILQLMVRMEQVDAERLPLAKTLLDEYANAETDAAKKAEAKLVLADLYRVSADSDKAIAAYKEILAGSPDNVDALAGAGLSLVNLGYIKNDKATLQEGANFLQKFVSVAPETHRYKKDAVGLIESLKAENVTPQKTSSKRKP